MISRGSSAQHGTIPAQSELPSSGAEKLATLGIGIIAQSHLQTTLRDAREQARSDDLDAGALEEVFPGSEELSGSG